uniref:Uncharacterized protein n=1 Tax=viral metagenome TaxID=1070528 RepID=A0A6C0HNA1_9ZZZZ
MSKMLINMLINLLIIIIIVILSYALCWQTKSFACQSSHIVIGLAVLVLYQVFNSQKVRNFFNQQENFQQLPDTINSFLQGENINRPSNQSITSMSPATSQQYMDKLDSLVAAVAALNQDSSATSSAASAPNTSTVDRLNLESLQQYQNFQIQYLQSQINKTKDLINSQKMTEISKQYKPIKVYSSCVVSNADGSTTANTPLSSTQQQYNPQVPQQVLNTLSQSSATTPSGPSLLQQQLSLSASTGSIGKLINQALNASELNFNVIT